MLSDSLTVADSVAVKPANELSPLVVDLQTACRLAGGVRQQEVGG